MGMGRRGGREGTGRRKGDDGWGGDARGRRWRCRWLRTGSRGHVGGWAGAEGERVRGNGVTETQGEVANGAGKGRVREEGKAEGGREGEEGGGEREGLGTGRVV